ncbi:MAG: YeeE/YedE family protein [Methylococcales bacterium]|jgi:uncharacterized protein|nr:YeeE/YedE family protein [Methylococcales bacterium]MBT7408555.1 YeeE/YedE family protein [Methylococcales bacterium]
MEIIFSIDAVIKALIGGVLMGTAATIMLLFNGRIMGVCGIAHGIFYFEKDNFLWRICFIGAMFAGGFVLLLFGQSNVLEGFSAYDPASIVSTPQLIIAGILVGFGTSLGRGCTTGHGICGMSRFGVNSLVATCTFMFSAGITVYFVKHVFQ